MLAHQVGSEVSLTELGSSLNIDKNTVSRYLDLLVEEREGKLFGYEMKWKNKSVTSPQAWIATYEKEARWELITPENFLDFVT